MFRKNTTGQYLYFCLVNASTGAALTGATVAGYRTIDGGSQASVTGTISEKANGQYELALSQADTNGNHIGFLFTATSAVPAHVHINPTAADPTNAASFGLTNLNTTISSRLASADYIEPANSNIAAIKAKTDNLPASPAATSDIPTAVENADALLKRDMSAVTGEAARSPLNAVRFLRNKWSISGGTLTVTKEDDATTAWTATLSTDAAADPVTGSDPS